MSIKEKLIDLYYYILQGKEKKENKSKLIKLSEIELIDYIHNIFDANVKIKAEEMFNQMKAVFYDSLDSPQTYEDLLIKYENDIRNHIKTELEQALIIDALRVQVSYKDTRQSSSKSDSANNRIRETNEVLKKENQNLKRLVLSYELMKEKAEENEKKLKLKAFRQEKENKTLVHKLNMMMMSSNNSNMKHDKQKEKENSKCQFETLSQKNSMTLLDNRCPPLLKKNIFRSRSSSRKDSLKNEARKFKTRSLLINHDYDNEYSFSKAKRNRSALDISLMSRNQQPQHSSRLATDRAVIKSYYNGSLVKQPHNVVCINGNGKGNVNVNGCGKRNINDNHYNTHLPKNNIYNHKNNSKLFKKNSKVQAQAQIQTQTQL